MLVPILWVFSVFKVLGLSHKANSTKCIISAEQIAKPFFAWLVYGNHPRKLPMRLR